MKASLSQNIKQTVIDEYSIIALRTFQIGSAEQRETICSAIYNEIEQEYRTFPGYKDEANLGLGCGFPFKYAAIKNGESIVDLGCGAGIDTFIAAALTGEKGNVTGIDLTSKLLDHAIQIAEQQKISNVDFKQGDIENIPLSDSFCDVIISNGVFSLLPDIKMVFKEMFRILKPGGRICIADITKFGEMSTHLYRSLLQYTGCLNGISTVERYCDAAITAGFSSIQIIDARKLEIPETIFTNEILATEFDAYHKNAFGLKIVNLSAVKK